MHLSSPVKGLAGDLAEAADNTVQIELLRVGSPGPDLRRKIMLVLKWVSASSVARFWRTGPMVCDLNPPSA